MYYFDMLNEPIAIVELLAKTDSFAVAVDDLGSVGLYKIFKDTARAVAYVKESKLSELSTLFADANTTSTTRVAFKEKA